MKSPMKQLPTWLMALLLLGCTGTESPDLSEPPDAPDAPDKVAYIVVPHPDDEIQAWSLIENTPDAYKVFIVLTRGEQTAFCGSPGYDAGTGEAPPTPEPAGRWTPSCEQARQRAFFDFMTDMATVDSGLPAAYANADTQGPFEAHGHTICRHDATGTSDAADCIEDRTAQVWTAPTGAVVWFNLGDGDLTIEEVEWAITTVRDNRAALGIDASLPNHHLIGASYWNLSHPDCFIYEHGDHQAVYEALWITGFGMGRQSAATCASDPDASPVARVSPHQFDHAFATLGDTRVGAHVVHYGWLWSDDPGYWPGDYDGQGELFHRRQTFRVRFGRP
ncbi:hypothetical protein [Candidatus Poriferisodalis sp.]|uniref:hypothetical protein n=1 Tax=Candidatus Poriferisodalis sp. TaxID=3101277 RepID=UPI003B02637A